MQIDFSQTTATGLPDSRQQPKRKSKATLISCGNVRPRDLSSLSSMPQLMMLLQNLKVGHPWNQYLISAMMRLIHYREGGRSICWHSESGRPINFTIPSIQRRERSGLYKFHVAISSIINWFSGYIACFHILKYYLFKKCKHQISLKLAVRSREKAKIRLRSCRGEELDRERNRRTNRMLIAMVTIFGASWMPLNLINLLSDFYAESMASWKYYNLCL